MVPKCLGAEPHLKIWGSAPILFESHGYQAVTKQPVPNRPEIDGKPIELGASNKGTTDKSELISGRHTQVRGMTARNWLYVNALRNGRLQTPGKKRGPAEGRNARSS